MRRIAIFVLVLAAFSGIEWLPAQQLIFNTQEFAPFTYMSGDVPAGPAVEIVKAVCKEAGIACTVQLLPWSRAQDEVAGGKAHALFLVGWNKERAETLYFSPAVLLTEYGVFVGAGSKLAYTSADQLAGSTVGVYGPSNTATSLEELKKAVPSIVVDMTPTDEAAFRKLDVGRVDAVYSNRDVGLALVSSLKLANVRYSGQAKSLKYYIAFSKKYVEKAIFDRFVAAYRKLYEQDFMRKILAASKLTIAPLE